jgi:hypothetical protein
MSSIGSLDKDIRRKILGPVLTEFSAEYMNARKAIRGGQDPKTYRFERRWEVSNAGQSNYLLTRIIAGSGKRQSTRTAAESAGNGLDPSNQEKGGAASVTLAK